jgi:hypothetical protein
MNLALRIGLPVIYTGAALATAPAPLLAMFLVDDPSLDPNSFLSVNAVISTAMLPIAFAGGAVCSVVTPTLLPLAHLAWTYGSVHVHFRQNDIYDTLENVKQRTWQTLIDSVSAVSSAFSISSPTPAAANPTSMACAPAIEGASDEDEDGFLLVSRPRVSS